MVCERFLNVQTSKQHGKRLAFGRGPLATGASHRTTDTMVNPALYGMLISVQCHSHEVAVGRVEVLYECKNNVCMCAVGNFRGYKYVTTLLYDYKYRTSTGIFFDRKPDIYSSQDFDHNSPMSSNGTCFMAPITQ